MDREIEAKCEWERNSNYRQKKSMNEVVIGKPGIRFGLRLNTESWVLWFIYNDCREKGVKESKTKNMRIQSYPIQVYKKNQ